MLKKHSTHYDACCKSQVKYQMARPFMTPKHNSGIDYNTQYRSLFENSRDIILFISKRDGQILEANVSALNAYQYSREELLSMTIYDLRSPDTHQDVAPQMAKAESSGLLFETHHRRKNGENFPVEVNSQGTFIQSENVLLSIIRDITDRRRADEALRESEERFRRVFADAHLGIVITTPTSLVFEDANPAFCRMLGYSAEELRSMTFADITHPDHLKQDRENVQKVGRGEMPFYQAEKRYIHKSGRVLWGNVFVSSIRDQHGTLRYFLSMLEDITEHKRAELVLRESEGKYKNLFNNAEVGIFRSRLDGSEVIEVNRRFLEIVGMTMEETLGKPSVNLWADPKEREEMTKRLDAVGKVLGFEYKMLNKREGSVRNCLTSLRLYREQGILEGSILDITERKRAEEALRESERKYRELSIIDGLTQLYNSRFFYHQLKVETDRADRYGHPLTLLLIDLDDFKRFNDAYGHVEGDQVLMRLGQVVKRCLRQTDSAYRYGGEEFTILLPMTTSADGAYTAERIRAEFKKESFSPIPGQEVYVTVSIGLAQYKPQEEIKAFVNRVDQLMYQGKKNGKDRVCCEE
jgi:diguanylate cyclase (GGDEF)-like protein/PAS domain S-box-containing protein